MFKITDKVKSVILWTGAVALCGALVWGNYQLLATKNAKIETMREQVSGLIITNSGLEKTIREKIQSDNVTEEVKTAVKEEEKTPARAKTLANEYVEKKLQEIEKKYAAEEQTELTIERKRVEISLERAKGLWLSYCLQEPKEKACADL